MVASRGVPLIPGTRDPRQCGSHWFAWCVPYVQVLKPETDASAWIAKGVRRTPSTSFDPRIKNYQWGDFTFGLLEAKQHGYETVILLDHEGTHVTEGPGFNVFSVRRDGSVVTPDVGMLEGVTRRTVLEICAELGRSVDVRPLPLDEVLDGAELFISSSAGGVMPLTRLDDAVFAPGEVTCAIRQRYWEWVRRPHMRTEIPYT